MLMYSISLIIRSRPYIIRIRGLDDKICVAYAAVVHTKCGNFDIVGHYSNLMDGRRCTRK